MPHLLRPALKTLMLFVALSLALFGLVACNKTSDSDSGDSSKLKIGFWLSSRKNHGSSWNGSLLRRRRISRVYGLIKTGVTDGEKALKAIDTLAASGAKGFVICTPDVKLGPAIVDKAKSNDLKLIAVDDRFLGADGKPMEKVHYLGISARKIGENVGKNL